MMENKVNFSMLYRTLQRTLFIYLAFFNTSYSNAQVNPTKIACVGNSITAGARLDHPELQAYPSVLSSMLAENGYQNYTIKNFGIGGATILRFGQPNLWKVLDSLKQFNPDIVIIKAGTNETVGKPRGNWDHIDQFEKDYSDYIEGIRKINPNCRIIICSPLDMVIKTDGLSPERIADLTLRRPRIWELRKRIRKFSKQEATYFLDLTRPFKDKTNLMTKNDGVHPNQDGYQYLADLVYKFIVKRKIVMK